MKKKKIVVILTVLLMLVICAPVRSYASSGFSFPSWSQLQSSANGFLNKGKNNNVSTSQMSNVFLPAARILLGFAVIVLVGVTIVMGIKYVIATPEEAAKLKQQLIGLVVSAVVIFGAVGIWTLAYNVFSSIF